MQAKACEKIGITITCNQNSARPLEAEFPGVEDVIRVKLFFNLF